MGTQSTWEQTREWFSRLPPRWPLLLRSLDLRKMAAMPSVTRQAMQDGTSLRALLALLVRSCKAGCGYLRMQMDESVHSQQQHDHHAACIRLRWRRQHVDRAPSVQTPAMASQCGDRQPYTFCSASKEEASHA